MPVKLIEEMMQKAIKSIKDRYPPGVVLKAEQSGLKDALLNLELPPKDKKKIQQNLD